MVDGRFDPVSPVDRLVAALERPHTALELAGILGYSSASVYDLVVRARRRGHKIVCRLEPEHMSVFQLITQGA